MTMFVIKYICVYFMVKNVTYTIVAKPYAIVKARSEYGLEGL